MKKLNQTDSEIFWQHVTKGEPDACWEWRGKRIKGYGHNLRMSENRASRMSWILENGPIPEGLHVLHKCDNPPCVNPNHLFLGTHQMNMDDRNKKGRNIVPVGSQCHTAILNEDQVRQILVMLQQGLSTHEIGLLFGVRTKVIRYIKTGKTWKHISRARQQEAA